MLRWFRNFNTMSKILLLVFIMFFLLCIVSFTGYRSMNKLSHDMRFMYGNYVEPLVDMLEVEAAILDNRGLLVSLLLSKTKEEENRIREMMAHNRKYIDERFVEYLRTRLSDEEKTLMGKIETLRASVRNNQDSIIQGVRDGDDREGMIARVLDDGDVVKLEDEYIVVIDQLTSLLTKLAEEMEAQAENTAGRSALQIAGVSLFALLLGFILAFLIARVITKPLGRMQKNIAVFAGGDLTCAFEAIGRDEIARMGGNLQEMADTLNNSIVSVKMASNHISDMAQDFSALAEETNASVEEFRSNVEGMGQSLNSLASASTEVNASVEEVASGAQTTAERGTEIARKVDQAMNAGESGLGAVQRAVVGIDGVARSAADAAKSVQELGNRTRQIQGFVSQIGGIADQTNLLALNAAIEAARAGETGRGFAVVAEEVRKLAEESNAAAKSIAELAAAITVELDQVVAASLASAKASDGAKTLSRETETTIESMIGFLRDIATATQDLAAVSEEQAASSEEIAETVQRMAGGIKDAADGGENIRNGATEVADAAERVAQGSETLARLAGEMQEMLAFFKTVDREEKNVEAKSRAVASAKERLGLPQTLPSAS